MKNTTIKGVGFEVHPRKRAPYLPIEGYDLFDVYAKPSVRKINIFAYCKRMCEKVGGTGFAITSHNCQFFCVRFFFHDEYGRSMVAHITPYHNHAYYVYD